MSWGVARAARSRPGFTLLVSLLLFAMAIPFLRKLRLETDLKKLLPDDYPSVQELNRVLDASGQGTGDLIVVIQSDNFDASLRYAEDLKKRLQGQPFARSVTYERKDEWMDRHALLYASLEDLRDLKDKIARKIRIEKLKSNPFYFSLGDEEEVKLPEDKTQRRDRRYYATEDGRILLVILKPSGTTSSMGYLRDLTGKVERVAKSELKPASYDSSIEVGLAGPIQARIDEYSSILRDLRSSAATGGTLILLLVAIYFRTAFALFLVFFPLVLGIAVSFALTQLVLGELNMFTAFLFLVLTGLGVDYGVLLLNRYLQQRAGGRDPTAALARVAGGTSRSVATSALTTAAAFSTLLITDFKGFAHFGFIASTGIVCVLLSYCIVQPALILLFERWRLIRLVPFHGLRIKSWPLSRGVLLGCMVLVFAAGYAAPRLKFEYDLSKLKSQAGQSTVWRSRMRDVLKKSLTPAVVLTKDLDELHAVEKAVREKIRTDPTPTIEKFSSIENLVPSQQEEKRVVLGQIRDLLDREPLDVLPKVDRERVEGLRERLEAEPITLDSLPADLKENFVRGGHYLGLIYSDSDKVKLSNVKDARRFAEDVRTIATERGVFHAASDTIVLTDVFDLMLKDGRTAFLSSFLVILILVLVDLRSVRLASLALVPLLAGMVWMLGCMYVAGMKLNFFNMIVLPALFGMGTDYGVHILHRYLEERSVLNTMRQLMGGILVCSLTTMFGFGGMITAHHEGLESIGILANIGLICVTVASLLFLPALISFLLERRNGGDQVKS